MMVDRSKYYDQKIPVPCIVRSPGVLLASSFVSHERLSLSAGALLQNKTDWPCISCLGRALDSVYSLPCTGFTKTMQRFDGVTVGLDWAETPLITHCQNVRT